MRATTQIKMRGVYNMRPLQPPFTLMGRSVLESAEEDTTIGQFYGSSNYLLVSDDSEQFAINGDMLVVAGELTPGVYTIIVGSDNGELSFDITVIEE